jgi:chromosomal replication initiation ATPase DnaA
MTRQLALGLPHRVARGRADFLVSASNATAFDRIVRWPEWPAHALVLHGPAGSGKTHLAMLWQRQSAAALVSGGDLAERNLQTLVGSGAVAVDDAEGAPERALLHLYNAIAEAGANLLIVARAAPAHWPIKLPDLASRLRAAPAIAIGLPDDDLLAAVLVKHFADRGLMPAPGVVGFLVRRMERSFAAAARLAARLDRLSLAAGRPASLALARQVLAADAAEQS